MTVSKKLKRLIDFLEREKVLTLAETEKAGAQSASAFPSPHPRHNEVCSPRPGIHGGGGTTRFLWEATLCN
jgi:hypothetical protein